MELGPVQIVVVGFADERSAVAALPELRQLSDHSAVRLVDILLVSKDEDGRLTALPLDDAASGRDLGDEVPRLTGALVGALIGTDLSSDSGPSVDPPDPADGLDGTDGTDGRGAWSISDAIPAGTAAAVALIEHRWAISFRGAVLRSGGFALEDTWLHPTDLIAVGALPHGR